MRASNRKTFSAAQAVLRDRLAFSRSEIAAMLGVSLATIERMIHAGKLRAVRVGRRRILVPRTELERLLG